MINFNTDHYVIPLLKRQKAFFPYIRERKKAIDMILYEDDEAKMPFFVGLPASFSWSGSDQGLRYWSNINQHIILKRQWQAYKY